jgi:hypothetical protein
MAMGTDGFEFHGCMLSNSTEASVSVQEQKDVNMVKQMESGSKPEASDERKYRLYPFP